MSGRLLLPAMPLIWIRLLALSAPIDLGRKGSAVLPEPLDAHHRAARRRTEPVRVKSWRPSRLNGTAGGPAVRLFSPFELLECLKAHRYTPLACNDPKHVERALQLSGHALTDRELPCGAVGGYSAVCRGGHGRCAHDVHRGWFCACPRVARGGASDITRRVAQVEADCVHLGAEPAGAAAAHADTSML